MLYIVLPVHNRKEITLRFIQQLQRQTYRNYRVVLIDDGCTDGTAEAVKEIEQTSIILQGDGSLWWAGSMQMAYDCLPNCGSTSLVMIANDDTIFGDDFLEKSIARFKPGTIQMPSAFVGDTQIDGTGRIDWGNMSVGLNGNPNCCSTRCILLTLEDYFKIGKWHPLLLPHYNSDTEWTYRAFKKGVKIVEGERVTALIEEDCTKSTRLFSIRNPFNPIYYTLFILMTCPVRYIPKNLFKFWYGTIRTVVVKLTHLIFRVRIYNKSGWWFSKGAFITLTINTNCNLRCPDCPLWIGHDEFPIWKLCTLEQWKSFIENDVPLWVSQYTICGGETTLVKWMPDLVNWLLSKGHHVGIYTNLFKVEELLRIIPNSRLVIYATFHHQDDKERYERAYHLLKDRYRIFSWEFEHPMVFPFSVEKEFLDKDKVTDFKSFHCSPHSPITKEIYCGAENYYRQSSEIK